MVTSKIIQYFLPLKNLPIHLLIQTKIQCNIILTQQIKKKLCKQKFMKNEKEKHSKSKLSSVLFINQIPFDGVIRIFSKLLFPLALSHTHNLIHFSLSMVTKRNNKFNLIIFIYFPYSCINKKKNLNHSSVIHHYI